MKARTHEPQELYNSAVDILEEMLKDQWHKDHSSTVTVNTLDEFIHCICGYMKTAYRSGLNGDTAPDVISAMRATSEPFMKATAAVIENAYITGKKAR